MKSTEFLGTLALALLVSSTVYAAPEVANLETEKGAVLTGEGGMTLYTFRKDAQGMSNCNDTCAENWPPFMATEGAMADDDAYSIITRADGTMQWAKDGMPLYYWIKDQKPGDITGDGVNDVWDLARP